MQLLGISRRVFRALLLKTGQTTQYGGYLDDGALQKGIVKAYSVLTTGQYSGTVNIIMNGKTDIHSNNCVLDLNTGLMWSRYPSMNVGPTGNGKMPWTTNGNGEGIFAYCALANLALLSGYSDWRIPNMTEGCSILVKSGGGLDPVIFPVQFGSSSCWSSNTIAASTTLAESFSPTFGTVGNGAKTGSFTCVLVRDC